MAAAVLGAPAPLAAASEPAANAAAPFAVEDGAYPGAQEILQTTGATLLRGDGHITHTSCDSPHQVAVWGRTLRTPLHRVCFAAPYSTGYLALNVPDTFRLETTGRTLQASLTTDGKAQTVDVPADTAVGVGEAGSNPASRSVLLELRITGAVAGVPAGPPPEHGTLPGRTDPLETMMRITVGDKRSCSGTLVDPSWVLTAASCFVDKPEQGLDVPAGAPADKTTATISRIRLSDPPLPSTYDVVELVPRTDRDLVLARLATPIRDVTPMQIATAAPAAGSLLTVGGFERTADDWTHDLGRSSVMQVGTVAPTGIDLAPKSTDPGPGNGPVCKGAAGGPAVKGIDLTPDAAVGQHQYRYELVAVNSRSWQNGCLDSKETEHSGAYDTRVDDLATWLQDKAGIYPASGYTPVTPTRVMDTRSAGGRTWAPVAGQGGNEKVLNLGPDSTGPFKLPQGASAVVLNVTVVNPSTAGFVAVEPNDKAKPTTSSVNFAAGQTVANLVTAPVGADGKVYLWTTTSDFDAIVDVAGYYSPTSPNKYAPKTPVRLLDTRSAGGPLGPGATKDVQITGQNDIPADATAAVVTLTAVQPTAGGFFIAHPTGATRPSTSNVNFTPGAIISNQAIVPIGAGGKISLFNSGGNTNAIVDLVGYYSPSATELFHPTSPSRLLDTRQNSGAPLAYGQVTTIGNLPATADAVVVNATTTGSDADGFFTLFAHGTTRPTSSSLNFSAGQNLSVHATVATGDKQIDLYNHATHSHAIVDLTGYFAKY
ncbi:trypsin-like serine protease [Kitasatospora arboriphila]|uniref:Peptidase S1 domain-containing protein n=1 Tax=Kitasatospora arboriphila TaxID=258052 RepID=A0ABN1TGV0_9ACTN